MAAGVGIPDEPQQPLILLVALGFGLMQPCVETGPIDLELQLWGRHHGQRTQEDGRDAICADLPIIAWGRGKEMSDHARFTVESGVNVYFADAHSLWHRGTNKNTNGLLRQHFPKGTDLSRWSARDIQAVANALNSSPRKTLGWITPAEVLNRHLLSA